MADEKDTVATKRDAEWESNGLRFRRQSVYSILITKPESGVERLRSLWPLKRIERLNGIASKPNAGQNSIFVIELLNALREALYG